MRYWFWLGNMWKKIRILCLLLILLVVSLNAYRDQNQNWSQPIMVLLHPVNADRSSTSQQYIEQLSGADLQQLQLYLQQQAAKFRAEPVYFYFKIGREIQQLPPKIPEQATMLDVVAWSLKFRFYAWQQHQKNDGAPSVTLYLNYYDPEKTKVLKHSTALEKGRIGSVNLFASKKYTESNKVVLVHELLHAFGASDKYDLTTGQPIYPIGYAFPQQQPLFPQTKVELMAGYLPTSATTSRMPESLQETVIHDLTALEIGWRK